MFLGREELDGLLPRSTRSTWRSARRETLADLSVTTIRSVRQTVAGLSGGQRQSVAVAKAVMWNSKLVILDEPTAALGVAQTRQVLDLVKRLGEQGLGVVLVSHNLHDVFEVADRITVLRLGQNVGRVRDARTSPSQGRRGHHRRRAAKVPGQPRRCSRELRRPRRDSRRGRRATVTTVGEHVRGWWAGRARRRPRLAADRHRPDHHRDRLPVAELELPDGRQLRQPHRPGRGRS